MFIPAFLDVSPCVQRRYILHFFGAVNMQKHCRGPIIAPEDYFDPPSGMITPDLECKWEKEWFANQNLPQDEDLNKIQPCPIPQQLLDTIITDFGSKSDAAVAVYAQRIPALEEWFYKTLDALQASSTDEIEALVLVVDIPSFSCVCREKGIPVLYYEFGGFREPSYSNTSYYSMEGVHLQLKLESMYSEFLQEMDNLEPWEMFTPREILALFLVPEKLKLLQQYDTASDYEAGVLAEILAFAPVQSVNYKSTLDLLDIAIQRFGSERIFVRDHPGDPLRPSFRNLGVQLDDSPSAVEFILKCRRIISRTSNSIVEALLWGKSVYTIDREPYGFACLPSLDGEALQTVDVRFLNFIAFAFYFPREFTYDISYMRWRLTKPSWIEIYRKNLEYCLTVHGVPKAVLQQPGEERLQKILEIRQVQPEDVANLRPHLQEWEEEEQFLRVGLDDPATADVAALQTVREKIRRLQNEIKTESEAAVSLDTDLPILDIIPELSCQTDFCTESTLFLDTGNGFSQDECCISRLTCRDGSYEVLFTIPEDVAEHIQALRWDPLEGRMVAVTPDREENAQLSPMNVSYNENGTDYFYTRDPMYSVTVTGQLHVIKLTGKIQILSQSQMECVFCETLNRQNELLQQMLNLQNELRVAREKLAEAQAPLYVKCLKKLRGSRF